jgi:hypothetical protein
MKKFLLLSFFALFFSVDPVSAQDSVKAEEEKTVYLFGVSISLADSVVYFTEIMPVEGAKIDERTGFLLHRQYYSYELKDYMNFTENMPGRTSAVYFSDKRSKLEKKEAALKKRLVEKQGKTVRYLGDKFKFIKP